MPGFFADGPPIDYYREFSSYFGLIKCTVLSPCGLFHPVLLHHGQDKLMFALCKTWNFADTGNQTSRARIPMPSEPFKEHGAASN